MTNQEILEKAFMIATNNGFRQREIEPDVFMIPEAFIYRHDFAKALFGEELHHETFIVPKELNKRFAGTKDLDVKPVWQYHLQQMVIAKDPIKYLGEHI